MDRCVVGAQLTLWTGNERADGWMNSLTDETREKDRKIGYSCEQENRLVN